MFVLKHVCNSRRSLKRTCTFYAVGFVALFLYGRVGPHKHMLVQKADCKITQREVPSQQLGHVHGDDDGDEVHGPADT